MIRWTLLLLSSLGLWAGWFALAYGLHGLQCGRSPLPGGVDGRWLQIALWIATLAVAVALEWWLRRGMERRTGDATLIAAGRFARATGAFASVFVGVPVLVLAPC